MHYECEWHGDMSFQEIAMRKSQKESIMHYAIIHGEWADKTKSRQRQRQQQLLQLLKTSPNPQKEASKSGLIVYPNCHGNAPLQATVAPFLLLLFPLNRRSDNWQQLPPTGQQAWGPTAAGYHKLQDASR